MLQRCTEVIVDYMDAAFARIWTLNAEATMLELQAEVGHQTPINSGQTRVPIGQSSIGLIAQERRPHLSNDIFNDPRLGDPDWARREGMVAFAGYPLIVDDELLGVVTLFAQQAYQRDRWKPWGWWPMRLPWASNANKRKNNCKPRKRSCVYGPGT
jgi:GAF domain-containing protein